ncbi:integrator complex subunit 10-like [Diadema antillarum]|uniref:integrator complex subunit 10-like n=1 Tax=Diadema antillarum TaxID=105358 RepID=UPI003A8450AD
MDTSTDSSEGLKTPQVLSRWFVEKSQTCLKQQNDRFACKAFLLTAKSIYPQNFEIQYQAYCYEKSAQDVKQAASILLEMFHKFQQEPQLLEELQAISKALQGDSKDTQTSFLKDVYEHLPTTAQKEILVLCIDQCQNILEKSCLQMLLLRRFNKNGYEEAVSLVETLLNTEKSEGVKHVINPYRKLMVYKILPVILSVDKLSQHCSTRQYSKWLQKTIEFFVTVAVQPHQKHVGGGEHLPHGMGGGGGGMAGGEGTELPEGSVWDNLQHILKLLAKSVHWETGFIAPAESGLGESWSVIQKHLKKSGSSSSGKDGDSEEAVPPKPAFYASLVLLLRASHRYAALMNSQHHAGATSHHHHSQVLLEDLEPKKRSKKHKHAHKKRKLEADKDSHIDSDESDDVCDVIQPSEMTALSSEITEAFHTAMNCWQLLNSNELFQKDFNWLLRRWRAETWLWFNSFQADRLLYLGENVQAVAMLQTRLKAEHDDTPLDNQERIKTLVQLASIYHSMSRLSDACDSILEAISILRENYVEGNPNRGIVSEGSFAAGGRSGRVLHIIPATPTTLLPYCIQLVLLAFKKRVLHRADSNDTGLGHLIVLMQYYWPRDELLFNEAIRRIRKRGHFSYHSFLSYIINIDILEEFAYLKTEDGGKVNLDLLPSSSSVQRQRTVTRGVTRGGKEDFRAAMERQVMRCNDNVEGVILKFLSEERDSIKLTLADS